MHHGGDAEHVRGGVRGAGAHGGDPAAGAPPAQVQAPPPRQLRHLRGGERAVQGEDDDELHTMCQNASYSEVL